LFRSPPARAIDTDAAGTVRADYFD